MEFQPEIGAATPMDIPALVALLGELFSIEREFTPDAAKQERGLRLILDNPALGRIFVARMDGQAVGMASLLFTVSTAEGGLAAMLEDVIVAAPYRRLRVGRRLLRHVSDWARAQGVLRLTLLVDKNNSPALRFYESEGFTGAETMGVYRHRLPPHGTGS